MIPDVHVYGTAFNVQNGDTINVVCQWSYSGPASTIEAKLSWGRYTTFDFDVYHSGGTTSWVQAKSESIATFENTPWVRPVGPNWGPGWLDAWIELKVNGEIETILVSQAITVI